LPCSAAASVVDADVGSIGRRPRSVHHPQRRGVERVEALDRVLAAVALELPRCHAIFGVALPGAPRADVPVRLTPRQRSSCACSAKAPPPTSPPRCTWPRRRCATTSGTSSASSACNRGSRRWRSRTERACSRIDAPMAGHQRQRGLRLDRERPSDGNPGRRRAADRGAARSRRCRVSAASRHRRP
jgi:hypothetical protein